MRHVSSRWQCLYHARVVSGVPALIYFLYQPHPNRKTSVYLSHHNKSGNKQQRI